MRLRCYEAYRPRRARFPAFLRNAIRHAQRQRYIRGTVSPRRLRFEPRPARSCPHVSLSHARGSPRPPSRRARWQDPSKTSDGRFPAARRSDCLATRSACWRWRPPEIKRDRPICQYAHPASGAHCRRGCSTNRHQRPQIGFYLNVGCVGVHRWAREAYCTLCMTAVRDARCFFPRYAYPYIATPLMLVRAHTAAAQYREDLLLFCSLPTARAPASAASRGNVRDAVKPHPAHRAPRPRMEAHSHSILLNPNNRRESRATDTTVSDAYKHGHKATHVAPENLAFSLGYVPCRPTPRPGRRAAIVSPPHVLSEDGEGTAYGPSI
ncbi:hypothetical protein C8Q77DRAFT_505495 [Trametes polyzona]|nr:hypothetical protein C8Q77DRAFT_505495 [Trametes polyzona]